ncbi:helix-turn-helix transcriptional regulator [Nocardioides aurantiacus]|uniref:DNA-binding NarL/FixJ family response regulator n=1 Tax=Nocardioides aurantiacus TaxID=86796 RepID=A0A3N2CTT8_9ACTN|nr:helix-turn-helix transcriptional regulator [Nocardioides aurantiacus]ROR90925.1 DNA-binding NarL/FixJ family response regulator [Nocardioides aurantiacus]
MFSVADGHAVTEGPEILRLRQKASHVAALIDAPRSRASGCGATVKPLIGWVDIVAELRRLQPLATHTVRVLQPHYSYDPEEPGIDLVRQAQAREVDLRLITTPTTLTTHPLLTSIFPRTLIGPVLMRAVIVDARAAVIGVDPDAAGNRVAMSTHSPHVVAALLDLWRATVPHCRTALAPNEAPPLTARQLQVARLICLGHMDQEIARTLATSLRTVEREIGAIYTALGTRSRTKAVLLMRGRGVNGGANVIEKQPRTRRG